MQTMCFLIKMGGHIRITIDIPIVPLSFENPCANMSEQPRICLNGK